MAKAKEQRPAITPEDMASMTKEFSDSPFGSEFIGIMHDQVDGYMGVARNINAPEHIKVAANERAAGIQELIDLIDLYCTYFDKPELLQKAKEGETVDKP